MSLQPALFNYKEMIMTTPHAVRNTVRKFVLIGLAVMGLGGVGLAAHAHEGRHGHAASMEAKQAKWQEHAAKRQARLAEALKLTPAQQSAWAAYQAAGKPGAAVRPEHGSRATLSAPARMEQRLAMAKQHIAVMETRLAALNTFYAVLTPEQKKVFDEQGMRGGHRGHHGMGKHARMHGKMHG